LEVASFGQQWQVWIGGGRPAWRRTPAASYMVMTVKQRATANRELPRPNSNATAVVTACLQEYQHQGESGNIELHREQSPNDSCGHHRLEMFVLGARKWVAEKFAQADVFGPQLWLLLPPCQRTKF